MPSIRHRGGKFHVQVRMSGFPSRTASFPTKRQAERWAKTIEAEMIEGRHFKSSAGRRRTMTEAAVKYAREILHVDVPAFEASADYEAKLAAFLERKWQQPTHPDTPADARNSLARLMWWRKELRDYKVGVVTPELIEEKLSKLRTEPYQRAKPDDDAAPARQFFRTEKTVNRYIAAGSRLFRIAHKRWHWIASNPFSAIERTGEGGGRLKILTVAQRARLFDEMRRDRTLYAFAITARATVVRSGDLQKLQKSDTEFFDGDDGKQLGRLSIRQPKNKEPRVVWIAGEPAEILRDYIASTDPDEPRVFCSPGRVYSKAGLRRSGRIYRYHDEFRAACKRAKIEGFTFHGFRHDGSTDLARLGATQQQLKAIGGWKSDVVAKYVHLAAADSKDLVGEMNKNMLGNQSGGVGGKQK